VVERVHATAVAAAGRGVLIRGPSGAGKSDLALRLLALPTSALQPAPFELVADDQVLLTESAGRIVARPPVAIAGLIEVRGVGVISVHHLGETTIDLVVDLVSDLPPRHPDPEATVELLGRSLRAIALAPFETAAAHKVAVALFHVPL
jgi:HPr kinase/phosphorylase